MLRVSVAGAVMLAAFAPAAMASGWSQPEPLSQFDGNPGVPAIVTGDSGGARAAWSQGGVFVSAERVPATPWSLPVPSADAVSGDLRLVPLGNSETLAVWAAPDGLAAALRPDGGPWGASQVIDAGGSAPSGLQVVSANGEAVVVWSYGAAEGVRSASYVDGDWSDVSVLSGEAPAVDPSVALDDSGRAIAVWRAAGNQIAAAERAAGGDWSEAEPVTTTGVPGRNAPQIALGSDDTVLAAWREPGQIAAAARAADGTWTASVGVATATRPSNALPADRSARLLGPRITADGNGTTAVWVEVATGRLLTRTRDAAGVWSDILALSPARENAVEPRASVDGDGTLRVTWIQGSGTGTRVRATERQEGRGFSAPVNLSRRQGEVHDLSLSIADDGNALAAWLRDTPRGDSSSPRACVAKPPAHRFRCGPTLPPGRARRSCRPISSGSTSASPKPPSVARPPSSAGSTTVLSRVTSAARVWTTTISDQASRACSPVPRPPRPSSPKRNPGRWLSPRPATAAGR